MSNLSAIGLLIAIVLLAGAGAIVAQEVLPFPEPPSASGFKG